MICWSFLESSEKVGMEGWGIGGGGSVFYNEGEMGQQNFEKRLVASLGPQTGD